MFEKPMSVSSTVPARVPSNTHRIVTILAGSNAGAAVRKSASGTKPSTTENPTVTLFQAAGVWQVSRRLSSLTLEIPDGGEPRLKCWAAAQGELR